MDLELKSTDRDVVFCLYSLNMGHKLVYTFVLEDSILYKIDAAARCFIYASRFLLSARAKQIELQQADATKVTTRCFEVSFGLLRNFFAASSYKE